MSKVVAAGAPAGQARIVVSLRPIRPPSDRLGVVRLDMFPSQIENLRSGMQLDALLIPQPLDGTLCPDTVLAQPGSDVMRLSCQPVGFEDRDLRRAERVWQQVMPETENGGFANFFGALDTFEEIANAPDEDGSIVCLPSG
ncbi:MAG: hypothetical protein V2I76_13410 [Roseobacter sp.]|nr:hypothetical protein [Roseobacter sp.]